MRYIGFTLLALMFLACDGGLAPQSVEPGFGGTITFAPGTWPPQDSLVNLWLVASQDFPLDSVSIIAGIFSNPPRIYVYPSLTANLPFNVDSAPYSFHLPPAVYKYVAVVQHINPLPVASSLRVVGLYSSSATPLQPQTITVREGEFIENININVNFNQLPPQPF